MLKQCDSEQLYVCAEHARRRRLQHERRRVRGARTPWTNRCAQEHILQKSMTCRWPTCPHTRTPCVRVCVGGGANIH
jgi:hypothetical protein